MKSRVCTTTGRETATRFQHFGTASTHCSKRDFLSNPITIGVTSILSLFICPEIPLLAEGRLASTTAASRAAVSSSTKGTSVGNSIKKWLQNVGNMGREDLVRDIEKLGFEYQGDKYVGSRQFKRGKWRIRKEEPHDKTPYNHMHKDRGKGRKHISYDIHLNRVKNNSKEAHIPIK